MRVPPNFNSWAILNMPPLVPFLKLADAAYTLSVINAGQHIRCTSPVPAVLVLPAQDNGQASWLDLDTIDIENASPGYLTIQPAAGVTLSSPYSVQAHMVKQGAVVKLTRIDINIWTLHGELDHTVPLQIFATPTTAFAGSATLNNMQNARSLIAAVAAGFRVDNTRVTTTSGF